MIDKPSAHHLFSISLFSSPCSPPGYMTEISQIMLYGKIQFRHVRNDLHIENVIPAKLAISEDGLQWKRPHHDYLLEPEMPWEGSYNLAKAAVRATAGQRKETTMTWRSGSVKGRKTILFQYVAAAILVLMLYPGLASAEQEDGIRKQAIKLGPGSAHPGTTGEVRLELEEFLLDGDPHACGIIWDLAVDGVLPENWSSFSESIID